MVFLAPRFLASPQSERGPALLLSLPPPNPYFFTVLYSLFRFSSNADIIVGPPNSWGRHFWMESRIIKWGKADRHFGHCVLRAQQGPRLHPLWTFSSLTCTPTSLCRTNAISPECVCVVAFGGTRARWFLSVWEWENISIAHLGCSCTVKLPVVSLAESKRQASSSFLLPPPPPLALLLSLDLLCSWHLSHTHFSLSLTLSPPFLCISSGREYGVSHYLMEIRREGKEPDLPVICLDLLGAEWNLLYWSRVLHICTCANSYPTIGASWLH